MLNSVIPHTLFEIGDLICHIMRRDDLGVVLESSYQPRNMNSWWCKELIEIVKVWWFSSGKISSHHYFNLEKR